MTRGTADQRSPRRWSFALTTSHWIGGAIEATLALIKLGRVTATSVLADSPHWKAAAGELKDVADRADVGLHLNLTRR